VFSSALMPILLFSKISRNDAAIVSRELKKVCIVGCKIATKVLKEGDLVEVDGEKGVVRKVKI